MADRDLPPSSLSRRSRACRRPPFVALGTTGYRLERARLCFLKKQIFLHLVYTKDGEEFSVYLRPRGSDSPFDGSVRQASVGAEDLAYFETDRLTAVFVYERSKAQAAAFARASARVL